MNTFGITITGDESVKSGSTCAFDTSHTFDPAKKITKIVTTFHKYENIMQIKFYSNKELLCTVGMDDD